MITTVPFSGFYNSWHDDLLDRCLEQMFLDDDGCPNYPLIERALDSCNWQEVRTKYAKYYTAQFGQEFKIPSLRFERLESPREYNFTTDRIFAFISRADVRHIWRETDKKAFAELCKEKFTSRSGFISFYDPDYKTWGKIDSWNHNQLGTLLECMAAERSAPYGWDTVDHYMMEDASGNGYMDTWIFEAIPRPVWSRLNRVYDYLMERAERK